VSKVRDLFGISLDDPEYVKERGEITLTYRTREKVRLDISSGGRGQQQTLLLLAHMTANPGSILLLEEPDAHLEILRQKQIYSVLTDTAAETGSQVLAASHSEVILNEAADRDIVIAFVGKPHRMDNRKSQVHKALRDVGFEHYYQAEEVGFVLYLEGSTDLSILQAFAALLDHGAAASLTRPFVHYVGNQPSRARDHFYALREAKSDLVGLALYDRLSLDLAADPDLRHMAWRRREIENYLAQKETLMAFAGDQARVNGVEILAEAWRGTMEEIIREIERALGSLGRPSPWSPDIKATDDFLDPVFKKFYERLGLPNLMRKTDYHILAKHVPVSSLDSEISEKLDAILEVSRRAHPRL
jgi:hypothetical protein